VKNEKGFTLIELMIVIAIIAIIAAIAIPNLIEARKGSNEAAAIGALRTLTTAQALFREGDKDKDTTLDYATSLTELESTKLIDGVLGKGQKQGYNFVVAGADQFTWSCTAGPASPGKSGDRYFFVDESGVIRFSTTTTAGTGDQAIGG
jgi:type IV pilus assembly protein PilA